MGERRESEIHVVGTVGTPGNEFTRTLTGQDFASVDVALDGKVVRLYVERQEGGKGWEWDVSTIMGKTWSQANEASEDEWREVAKGRIG